MSELYRIEPDVEGRCLRITLDGFWSPETVPAYVREVGTAMDRMAREAPGYVVLCDARAMPVQSREVAEAQGAMVTGLATREVPTAIVVAQVLNKMQADRMVGETRGIRVFRDMGEAQGWLARKLQDRQ